MTFVRLAVAVVCLCLAAPALAAPAEGYGQTKQSDFLDRLLEEVEPEPGTPILHCGERFVAAGTWARLFAFRKSDVFAITPPDKDAKPNTARVLVERGERLAKYHVPAAVVAPLLECLN